MVLTTFNLHNLQTERFEAKYTVCREYFYKCCCVFLNCWVHLFVNFAA